MYHNTSPTTTQDSNMNLLTSPFDPDQLDYVLGYTEQQQQQQQQPIISQEPQSYSELEIQQLQQQMHQNEANIWNASFMPPHYSPTASTQPLPSQNNTGSINDLYNQPPSPQASVQPDVTMNTSMSHDFASRSPESSSSAESNLVSPPQQYHPSNNDYSDLLHDSLSIPPPLVSKHPHHHHARRSSSVPPHFHRFKQHQHQLMQVVDPNFPYTLKQPPIQIKRVVSTNTPAQHAHPSMDTETYKTQLDEKLRKVNFDDITVAELKDMLRDRGLSATGRKAELMARLKEEQDVLFSNKAAVIKAPGSPALHRRVANISLTDSPTMEKKRFSPYSTPPQRHSSISIAQINPKRDDRMASSLPDTSAFLNDQFMMRRKPSTLRNSLDETDITLSESPAPPQNTHMFYYPTVEKIEEAVSTTDDVWDEQMLQNFLNQI